MGLELIGFFPETACLVHWSHSTADIHAPGYGLGRELLGIGRRLHEGLAFGEKCS